MNKPATRPCPGCGGMKHKIKFVEDDFYITRCSDCALVYLLNPPPEQKLYEDYYDDIHYSPSLYGADSPDAALGEYFAVNRKRVETLKRFKPTGSLLDIGCGKGLFLKSASDGGYDVWGLDVSQKATDFVRREYGFEVMTGNIDAAKGPQFDIITLWHVLEHFADPLQKLKHIRRLLNPGGICFIEVPNLNSIKFVLSGRKWSGGNHPRYHRTFFTTRTLAALLKKSGFSTPRRLRLSYDIPGRSKLYRYAKRGMNLLARDAFLDFLGR